MEIAALGGFNRTPSWVEVRAEVDGASFDLGGVLRFQGEDPLLQDRDMLHASKRVNRKMQKNVHCAKKMHFKARNQIELPSE
jgi:hypothetical protein